MYFINNSIETTTRFDPIKFFEFNRDNIDCLSSFIMLNLKNLPIYGSYVITIEEKRPDLLSYNIYKDTQYWWILLAYNKILNVNELISGLTVNYPSLNSLEQLYINASTYQKTM